MQAAKMKRSSIVIVAALFAVASLPALADDAVAGNSAGAMKMTDAQLDQVTAGGVISANLVFNAGNAQVLKINPATNHVTCVNCDSGITLPSGTSGVVVVVKPNGTIMMHAIRQMPF